MMPGYSRGEPQAILPEQRKTLAWRLSDGIADRYITDVLAPSLGVAASDEALQNALDDGFGCLKAVFDRYAFARRGKDRRALAHLACVALDRWNDAGRFELAPAAKLWDAFCGACDEAGRKPQADINQGVITGLTALCQDIYRNTGCSLAKAAAVSANEDGRIEPIFFAIVELRGVGPKIAATMLRDWIFAYGAETAVCHRDTIYLQPIDRWIRMAGPWLLEEAGADEFPDWILAGKLGKAARSMDCSGVRLNMGINWLGMECSHLNQAEPMFQERLHRLTRRKSGEILQPAHPA